VTIATTRRILNGTTGEPLGHHLLMWCPGCDSLHQVDYTGPDGVVPQVCWTFDGNLDAPTVSPSLLVRWNSGPGTPEHVCHSFIVAGRWQFLSDSTHPLAGQTIPLPRLPDWVIREGDQHP
jgi:hypothetical protein